MSPFGAAAMHYLPYDPTRDEPQFTEAQAAAFDVAIEHMQPVIENAGIDNIRVVRDESTCAGGLFILPIAQQWHGRSLPTACIAAVGVAPHMRARGFAGLMMREALREARGQGMALSTLYPASVSLYRKFGYELAGSRFHAIIETASIPQFSRVLNVLPLTTADEADVDSCYQRWSAESHGQVCRNRYLWRQIQHRRGQDALGFCIREEGDVTGYLYYRQQRIGDVHHQRMIITDIAYTTAAAARRLLTFMADHRSLVRDIFLPTGPNEPILSLLPEQSYELSLYVHWMTRILDVPAALSQRGWPATANGELQLAITDDLFDDNTNRFILSLKDGVAIVEPGGDGRIQLDVRALASLYTGYASARHLATIGKLTADAADIAIADTLFTSPYPWMRDQF